jgi:hypothetical protein
VAAMGFLAKLFGYRWCLCIIKQGQEIKYEIHSDSAFDLALLFSRNVFVFGGKYPKNYRFVLRFNHTDAIVDPVNTTHPALLLELLSKIAAIDPDYEKHLNPAVFTVDSRGNPMPDCGLDGLFTRLYFETD